MTTQYEFEEQRFSNIRKILAKIISPLLRGSSLSEVELVPEDDNPNPEAETQVMVKKDR
jgi:hypothetical protein